MFPQMTLPKWLEPIKRPIAVIDASSSSSPFLNKLSGQNRVIITATKSGYELSYARFGQYISDTITEPSSDLDKDGQTSLLEAFLAASRGVQDFYSAAKEGLRQNMHFWMITAMVSEPQQTGIRV